MKKMTRLSATLAGLLVAGAITACAGRLDEVSGSPSDARVQALVDANRRYPRWEDFPPAPTNLPQPVEIAEQVNTLRATGGALNGEVSRLDWTLDDVQASADAQAARAAAAVPVSPDTAQTQEDIDAFARRLRERGRAPPPIDRR